MKTPDSKMTDQVPFAITNISDGETVHQRCLILTGTCAFVPNGEDRVTVRTSGVNGLESFPEQSWVATNGFFKAMVILSPGSNILHLTHQNGRSQKWLTLNVTYLPLLQTPPLHLAIMVAKDSPLLIDCPPQKFSDYSSAHSDIKAAIAKFRMTAYMWQAMVAEDLRSKGLGLRTFRLDEEWSIDTVSRRFLDAHYGNSLAREGAARATAKVHIVRSSKTTAELRDPSLVQRRFEDDEDPTIHSYFLQALKEAGGPFEPSKCPVVAGLILDTHYDGSQVLGNTALGIHDPNGISLGVFGSHYTYAWPRFVEELESCLLDWEKPVYTAANRPFVEWPAMWKECSVGQTKLLRRVGHAFGLPVRFDPFESADDSSWTLYWPMNFLSRTDLWVHRDENGYFLIDKDFEENQAKWHLGDALTLRLLPHFWLPADPPVSARPRNALVQLRVLGGTEGRPMSLAIHCPAGIAQIMFQDAAEDAPSFTNPVTDASYTEEELERRFPRTEPLRVYALGLNGKEKMERNVWQLFNKGSHVRIPGSDIVLQKRSLRSEPAESGDLELLEWAQLLNEKGRDGEKYRATSIELCVGCVWDGGIVKYEDGHKSHWGPMRQHGEEHQFGGHATERISLPSGAEITKVKINRGPTGSTNMYGVRMYLSNGKKAGELNSQDGGQISTLRPRPDEVIVGFFGKSDTTGFYGVVEFGIITAPKEVGLDGLPDAAFELPQLRNTCVVGENMERSDDDDEDDPYRSQSDSSDDSDTETLS